MQTSSLTGEIRVGPAANADPWCRSCGASATSVDAACPACGVGLDPPDPGPLRIGRFVTIQGRIASKIVVAIDERDGAVTVMAKPDDVQAIPLERFTALEP